MVTPVWDLDGPRTPAAIGAAGHDRLISNGVNVEKWAAQSCEPAFAAVSQGVVHKFDARQYEPVKCAS